MGEPTGPDSTWRDADGRPGLVAYLVALTAVVVSTVAWYFLEPQLGDTLIFSIYFAAIVVASWYGGLWPGVLAIVLSCISAKWFFISPIHSLHLSLEDTGAWIGILTFAVIGLILAGFSEALHRSRSRAQVLAEQRASAFQAAAEQRELLSVTLASIGDAVIATDDQGRISFLNSVAESLIGTTAQDATGRALRDVFHIINERTRAPVDDPCARVLQTGRVVGLANHTVLISKDGRERPIDDSAAPIKDKDGKVLGVVLIFRDATEHRGAQEANERLAAIVEHSGDAIIGKRLDGTITSWNAGAQRLYGFEPSEAIGQPIAMIVPPDRRNEQEEILARLRRGEHIERLETVRQRKDGTRIDVSITVSPIKNSYGEVIGASKIARDISAQKRAREILQRSEEMARFLGDASTSVAALVDVESSMQRLVRLCADWFADWCVFYLVDEQRRIQPIARAHCDPQKDSLLSELTTRYPHDWRDSSILARVLSDGAPECLPDIPPSLYDSAKDARHGQLIDELAPKSMIVVPLESRGRPIGVLELARSGQRPRFTSADFEIAQELARRAATALDNYHLYEELRRADRQKDDFLAMLAHELRNPLAAIDYATRLASISPDQAANASEIIHRQVRQLVRLIEDLLDVSRITRDKIELKREPIDAATLLNRAAGTARPTIDEHKHQLVIEAAPEEMPLFADPTRAEQIVVNLLTNAAKYTPEGGHITLQAFPDGDHIVIRVKDTGIGIPVEMLPRVFELFTQVNPQIDRSKGGLGIGLTVVRKLTEMHGGSISATSEGLGRGSEFTVRLPRDKDRVGKDVCPAPVEAGLRHGLRVLVVEDNVDTARSMSLLLDKAGCATKIAHDGVAALEAADSFQPEVVLLDIGLPGLDGYQVASRLRANAKHSGVQLIAVSGYGKEQDQQRSKVAGFDQHLVKPVDFNALLAMLAK
jgi:PAS domain S-box-containing protein